MKVDIKLVKNNPKNPRVVKDEQFKKLVKSIKDFPEMLEKRPIVCFTDTDGKYVALGGNMRLKACKEAGLTEVHVSLADDWTEEQKNEFIIKDNLGYGEWDMEKVLKDWDVLDLEEWGMDIPAATVRALTATEDDVEGIEVEKLTQIKEGDIIEIGKHRLMCGDSVKEEDVDKLMNGKMAQLCLTDPPYLMAHQGFTVGEGGKKSNNFNHIPIKNDKLSKEDGEKFLSNIAKMIKKTTEGPFYVFFYRLGIDKIMNALTGEGLRWRNLIIWKKQQMNFSMGADYKSMYEPLIYGYTEGWKDDYTPIMYGWVEDNHNWRGDTNEIDVWSDGEEVPSIWEVDRTKANDLHPTMKPIKLLSRAIQNSSLQDDIVLDLFLGSGSTMVACEQMNRICYGIELEPKYCQVIVDRMWQSWPDMEVKINGVPYLNPALAEQDEELEETLM